MFHNDEKLNSLETYNNPNIPNNRDSKMCKANVNGIEETDKSILIAGDF